MFNQKMCRPVLTRTLKAFPKKPLVKTSRFLAGRSFAGWSSTRTHQNAAGALAWGQLWFLDREKLNSGAKCGGFCQKQMGIEWGLMGDDSPTFFFTTMMGKKWWWFHIRGMGLTCPFCKHFLWLATSYDAYLSRTPKVSLPNPIADGHW